PGALAREDPVGTIGDHGAQTVLAGCGIELGGVDGVERAMAQRIALRTLDRLVHVDKPLRGVAEDDRLLGAPGMGILVLDAAAGDEVARFGKRGDDALVGVALLAIVVDDARAVEAWRLVSIKTIVTNGIGDGRIDTAILQQA